ncbi:hypothetical protein FOA43_003689 [Brettanomyces nanus]|uniref:3-ketodihydrosphingosine reductase TSC10 n=1 Tax=Eeniella nana TaxID=13502 RepID=A0A875S5V3_EENNA|nr:uncharacterized protein FOA43_003689 [Brettanomyces nanus]QPG76303.1 hypothetical protein FOA43_003689 [Brettanomyces nanus]
MKVFSNQFDVDGKVGIISGSSQGLGLAMAKQLYSKGASVILISRSTAKLQKAKKSILGSSVKVHKDQFVQYLAADLIDYNSASQILPLLDELKVEKPDFLICCAGAAHPQYFLNMTGKDLDFGIDTNYKTCVNLVQLVARRMVDESTSIGEGGLISDMKTSMGFKSSTIRHIVLISSEVAFFSFIGYAEYAPAKAAIKAFGDAIRQELAPYNVMIHVVFPGNFASEGYVEENRTKPAACKELEGPSSAISSDRCSQRIVKGLERGQVYIFTDFMGWLLNSFSLGIGPRNWGIFQVFFALIGAMIGGIFDFFNQVTIFGYFRKEKGFIKDKNN